MYEKDLKMQAGAPIFFSTDPLVKYGRYTPMHEVTPKVVAMAVSTVMMMLMIFPQMFLFSIVLFDVLRVDGFVVCCVVS